MSDQEKIDNKISITIISNNESHDYQHHLLDESKMLTNDDTCDAGIIIVKMLCFTLFFVSMIVGIILLLIYVNKI